MGHRQARTIFGLGMLVSFSLTCARAGPFDDAQDKQVPPLHAGPSKASKVVKAKKESKSPERTVWNLEGGAFFATDGGLPNGACFRLSGNVTAPGFFENLKRVDDAEGTTYRRGPETVTYFPEELDVTFSIRDAPCSLALEETTARPALTREMMSSLRLQLFWKHGVALREIGNARIIEGAIKALEPYAADLAKELPPRYEWFYSLKVRSADVPLTDSLVFVVETPDGRTAARVAARL